MEKFTPRPRPRPKAPFKMEDEKERLPAMKKNLLAGIQGVHWKFICFMVVMFAAGALIPARGDDLKPAAKPASDVSKKDAWVKVLRIAGAELDDDFDPAGVLGPLPSDSEVVKEGSLTPAAFAELYDKSGPMIKRTMKNSARSRLRELSRRGDVPFSSVAALIGWETMGVHGSKTYGIAPVPGESYEALKDYISFCVSKIPGFGRGLTIPERERLDRSLQVSLAVSSQEVRLQFSDFDVVWANASRHYYCSGENEELLPGMLWLYGQIREPSGLEFLPQLPLDLKEKAAEEKGELFAKARSDSERMPSSIAAITFFPCP